MNQAFKEHPGKSSRLDYRNWTHEAKGAVGTRASVGLGALAVRLDFAHPEIGLIL